MAGGAGGDGALRRVLVTGAAGFLGRRLTAALLARDDVERVDLVDVVDVVDAAEPATADGRGTGGIADRRAHAHVLDATDAAGLARVAREAGTTTVVHLAAMVSAACEADPAGAWRTNVEGTRAVLAAAAAQGPSTRVVVTSSVAVFGPTRPGERVSDATAHRPRSTYGLTKAVGELLVDEATRRGQVDGRVARLPTVVIRPGRPNRAASGFASGLFREPLAGVDAVVPVALSTPMALIGPTTAVQGIIALAGLAGEALGAVRAVGFPALEVTVGDMVAALARAGERHGLALGRLDVRPDPAVEAIVGTWPGGWDAGRALALGLPGDAGLDAVVDEHLAARG
jgi:nucleoside-diphosphate-sugar epimerase